jgi:hypothetical protein
MNTSSLSFNLLTFDHPVEEFTFYFSNSEAENLVRLYKTAVPSEVIDHFGEQDHYYTSFKEPISEGIPVTKKTKPLYKEGVSVGNSAFSKSILRKYYNQIIHNYFTDFGCLVRPSFINDVEVWVKSQNSNNLYSFYERFSIKVEIARITNKPELLISYEHCSRLFKQSVSDLMELVAPEHFNWVVYNNQLFRYKMLPDEGRRNLSAVYPVRNFNIRVDLNQPADKPDKTNRYKRYNQYIQGFITKYLNTKDFILKIPLTSGKLEPVNEAKINTVSDKSNQLLFEKNQTQLVPLRGMQNYGPFDTPPTNQIHFFYIYHPDNINKVKILDGHFRNGLDRFTGLKNFIKTPYFTPHDFTIQFHDKNNPVSEIRKGLERNFDPDISYMAIYISPFNKDYATPQQLAIYYKVKEALLEKGITSQAIDASKISSEPNFQYSLTNIAIAILAKLNGTPWRLNVTLKNELVVGVGAFKSSKSKVRYIGSAFSFTNNGKFNKFECFMHNQTDELAGSILQSIKDYISYSNNLKRLIIHYYKDMSDKEFDPIEKGLKSLGFGNIPIFIVAINKTESSDIVAFDNNYEELMPNSGTFINIGFNKFLLFNNTRYNGTPVGKADGFPFPVKLKITCNIEEKEKDIQIIRELIDQVYQFSRMYWKSVRQQNLPITIKYPEMVAEIAPHFDCLDIPTFGKDNLWFL